MKNYISINGLKTELTEEQIEQIKASFGLEAVRLCNVSVGDTVKIGDYEMIVLEQSVDTTALICKDFIDKCSFGGSNNYDGSEVDKLCNNFATDLAKLVGEDNVIRHTVDLTSDDGLKDYGSVKRFASLLTADRYRRHVYTLDKFKPDSWWWLATPETAQPHGAPTWILCVSPSGLIDFDGYFYDVRGVRPILYFNSSIFESSEN